MRLDLDVIENWIAPSSRVLDLGCGDGSLLLNLKNRKQVKGVGIEINPEKFNLCIRKGLSVIEQDVDKGLSNFGDKSFDVVVMRSEEHTSELQSRPHLVCRLLLEKKKKNKKK